MSFIQNLLKKIEISKLADKVLASVGPPGSMKKVDKEVMIKLLEFGGYHKKRERDLDLYLKEDVSDKTRILVLDNELAIYHTTIDDVVLRKSPTVKEMVRIKNIFRIINDDDVVESRREDSVKTIEKECIEKLNLSFDHSDLDEMANKGPHALDRSDTEGVIQCLALFAELLGYKPPPRIFRIKEQYIMGAFNRYEDGTIYYGPIIIYSITDNLLKFVDEQINTAGKEKVEQVRLTILGEKDASIQGTDVFLFLNKAAKKLPINKPLNSKTGAKS